MAPATVPIDGNEWPNRGIALAAWLNLGIDAFKELAKGHRWEPCPNSLVAHDRLTISSHEPRHASAGAWFALLTLTGAGEMVRALASLYNATVDTPLTRGHLPIMRSIQEHIGRVIWLCEPGAIIHGPGQPSILPTADDWGERRYRAILAYEEWMKDCVSHFRMTGNPDLADAEQEYRTAQIDVAASRAQRPSPATKWPGYTGFAEIAHAAAERLFGRHGVIPPKLPYKRTSETNHGGLYGLHGDKTTNPAGLYDFAQSDADLDAIATAVAAWWTTAVVIVSAIHGWDADTALQPFKDTWAALFQLMP